MENESGNAYQNSLHPWKNEEMEHEHPGSTFDGFKKHPSANTVTVESRTITNHTVTNETVQVISKTVTSDSSSNQSVKDALRNLGKYEPSLANFKENIENKDIVVFLGNTRNGKSTVINYLIQNELEAYKIRKNEYQIETKKSTNGPSISHESVSCTTAPSAYVFPKNPDIALVDTPGFEDNRGVIQNIINAFCIRQIRSARKVRFILVIDIGALTSVNIQGLTSCLEQAQALVSNYAELKQSFGIIFTRDCNDYTQAEIVKMLEGKILNVKQFDTFKTLVKNIAANEERIAIFKMPDKVGPIDDEIDLNIEGAIEACRPVDVAKCQFDVALSNEARNVLLQIYPEYTDENYFESILETLVEMYGNYFNIDKYVFASYNKELEMTKSELEEIMYTLQTELNQPLTYLYELQHALYLLLDDRMSSTCKTKFEFIVMLEEYQMLPDEYKEKIFTNYLNGLSKLLQKLSNLLKKIDDEQNERNKNSIKFEEDIGTVGAGICGMGVAGVTKAGQVVARAIPSVRNILQSGSAVVTASEIAIGGIATVGLSVGAIAIASGAAAAGARYQETHGKRKEARKAQNRD